MSIRDFIAERFGYAKKEIANAKSKMTILPWDKISEDEGTMSVLQEEAPSKYAKEYLKAAKSWVYTCVSAISDEIATINFHLFKVSGKEVKEVFEHDILDLLYKTNPYTTKFDHFWLTQEYLELAGEAPWVVDRGENKNGKPTSIWLLRPDKLTIIPGKDKLIEGYKYEVESGHKIDFAPEEIIFLKYPDPERPLRGAGTLAAAAQTVDLDYYSEKWNLNFMYNSARPDAVLTTDKPLTEEMIKRMSDMWKKMFKGVDKNSKLAFLEGGLQYKQLQISQKDMDFLEQQKFTRDKILSIFRVPKSVVAITDDVNRSNAETSAYTFARWTVRPKMQRIVDQLNEFFVPMFGDDLFLTFDDPVPENTELKLKRYESGLKGWMTANEVREEEGKDPIEGGDTLYVPFGAVPVGSAGQENQPSKEEGKIIIPRHSLIRVKSKLKFQEKISEVIRFAVENQLTKKVEKTKEAPVNEISKEEKFWNSQIKIADKHEIKIKNSLVNVFENQRRETLKKLYEKSIDINSILLNVENESKIIVSISVPTLKNIIKEQGNNAFSTIGITDAEIDILSAEVINYLKKKPIKFAKAVNKVTNKKIRTVLEEGLNNEEGIPQLAKRVGDVFDEAKGIRAETIARTETFRATGFATEEAYRQSGIVKGKEWLVAFDERTCEFCLPMNGKRVDLGENFFDKGETYEGEDGGEMDLDYDAVAYPPLHPRCRCTLIPVLGKRSIEVKIDQTKIEEEKNKAIKDIKEVIEKEKEKGLNEIRQKRDEISKILDENNG